MNRIPMVKCFVLKKSDDPINKESRYIPLDVFELWKYYMQSHHKFLVLEEIDSLWIDEEEHTKYLQIYERLALEEVREIKIILFSYETQLIIPVVRYIEEENYEKIKHILLSHYSDRKKGAMREIREIKERRGFWIKR